MLLSPIYKVHEIYSYHPSLTINSDQFWPRTNYMLHKFLYSDRLAICMLLPVSLLRARARVSVCVWVCVWVYMSISIMSSSTTYIIITIIMSVGTLVYTLYCTLNRLSHSYNTMLPSWNLHTNSLISRDSDEMCWQHVSHDDDDDGDDATHVTS